MKTYSTARRTRTALAGVAALAIAGVGIAPGAFADEGEDPTSIEGEETPGGDVDPEGDVDPDVDPEEDVDPDVDPEEDVDPDVDPEEDVDPDVDPEEDVDPDVDPDETEEVADLAAPEIALVRSPYTTMISDSATFEFAADQDVTWSYVHNGTLLDEAGPVLVLTGLASGVHELEVTAAATSGDEVTTVAYEWEVKTLADLDNAARRVRVGDPVRLTLSGLSEGEVVTPWLVTEDGDIQIGDPATAVHNGYGYVARMDTTVPDVPVGSYLVEARTQSAEQIAYYRFDVVAATPGVVTPDEPIVAEAVAVDAAAVTATDPAAAGDGLAQTGANPWLVGGGAMAALAAGGGLLVLRRVRNAATSPTDVPLG